MLFTCGFNRLFKVRLPLKLLMRNFENVFLLDYFQYLTLIKNDFFIYCQDCKKALIVEKI